MPRSSRPRPVTMRQPTPCRQPMSQRLAWLRPAPLSPPVRAHPPESWLRRSMARCPVSSCTRRTRSAAELRNLPYRSLLCQSPSCQSPLCQSPLCLSLSCQSLHCPSLAYRSPLPASPATFTPPRRNLRCRSPNCRAQQRRCQMRGIPTRRILRCRGPQRHRAKRMRVRVRATEGRDTEASRRSTSRPAACRACGGSMSRRTATRRLQRDSFTCHPLRLRPGPAKARSGLSARCNTIVVCGLRLCLARAQRDSFAGFATTGALRSRPMRSPIWRLASRRWKAAAASAGSGLLRHGSTQAYCEPASGSHAAMTLS